MNKVIRDCAESIVFIEGGTVRKIYNGNYYYFNRIYDLEGEPYFLEKYKSPYFIELVEQIDGGVRLKNGGVRLGGSDRFDRPLPPKDKLVSWLLGLKEELQRLGIRHRDINPRNIVYDGKEFKLIDFSFATEEDHDLFDEKESSKKHRNYGRDDNIAIDRMLADLK
jgi:serine/threonine protein kinase